MSSLLKAKAGNYLKQSPNNGVITFTGKEIHVIYCFPTADPYLEEVKVFLEAVRSGNPDLIRSSYADAAKTYRLSWDIRKASE